MLFPVSASSMAIILCLPFTYSMSPITGILLLVAVYVGGACGGSISAILLKTPGTPESVATTFDGYPMAMRGEAGLALGLAVSASSFGTIFFSICHAYKCACTGDSGIKVSKCGIFCTWLARAQLYHKHRFEKSDESYSVSYFRPYVFHNWA